MGFADWDEFAIRAVMLAQELGDELRTNSTTSDLLLYGCMKAGFSKQSGAFAILTKLGLTADKLKNAIAESRGMGTTSGKNFSSGSFRVITRANQDNNGGAKTVDTVQVLLAIVAEEDCSGAKLLKSLGISLEDVKKEGAALRESSEERTAVGVGASSGGSSSPAATLEKYTEDLTQKARDGKLDPVVGREEEIERAILVLKHRRKNNPVLLGDPGVGKTAIAEGIAQRIAAGTVPEFLKDKQVKVLDVSGLLAGTKYRGDFEERLTNIINEVVASNRKIILMIDEIHTIIGAGGAGEGGAIDAGNIMKPKLANGELQVMGATTRDEYRKYIEKDKALERRFKPIIVPEPSVEQTIDILKGIAYKYEDFHGLVFSPEAIEACAKLSEQYVADRYLPDKAIDILDMTGTVVSISNDPWMQQTEKTRSQTELEEVLQEKARAEKAEEYEKCAELKKRQEELEKIVQQEASQGKDKQQIVSEADVSSVVSRMTGIPVSRVASNESSRLLSLEGTLHKRVIGQHEAVVAVSKAVRRARSGLKDANRPIASFIFAGPTGVGKTELCKALAKSYYGNEKAMLRFDMSEFMERHTVSKLIGSPPGYVGYDDETQLCDRIRRNPYSLILFDEIEKAHPDIFNIMLQILEDGRLTDSKGRVVSFKNALIIMTSNVGAQNIQKNIEGGGGFGFNVASENEDEASYENLKKVLGDELKNRFKPEFINRLDDTIVFKPLTKEEVRQIAEIEFNKVFDRVKGEYNTTVELTEKFQEKVLEDGYDPKFGARPLRRAIRRLLEDELAGSVLSKPFVAGEIVVVDVDEDDKVVVERSLLSLEKSLAGT